MMLIPQPVGLGPNDNHKTAYFADSTGSSPSIVATVSGSSNAGAVNGPQAVFSYPAADGCLIPGRMQSELSGLNMYGAQAGSSALASPTNYGAMPGAVATAPGLITPHYGSAGIEHSPYYSALGPSYDMKPAGGEMWTGAYPQPPPGYYPYDNTFGPQYPYDRYCSMDMNDGVRRKNATRESTNTLKTWLQEHKKNPYPTKGEKIMLAIITKMTLTQVSTWFANARRRLKKENKMTWVPKNRSNESSGGSQQDKKEDGDDDDSQHNDDGDKSENGHGGDSDDSAEREVTSTNNNDSLNSSFPHQQDPAVFDDERVDSYNSGPASAHSSNDKTSSVSYPTQRDGDFATAGNLTCDPGHDRFIPPEGPNRGIWSPVNDHQRPFPVIGAPERHDMEHNPGYASQYSASAFGGPAAIVPRHQHGIVSPPDLTEPGDGQPRADFHYPPAQSWSEHGYPSSNSNTLRAAPESCSIGGGGGSESTDGRTDVGSPGDYQRQYACIDPYQRVGGGGSQAKELYLGHPGMYTQARGREIPGTSPNPSNLGRSVDPVSPYASAEYGHVVDYYTVDRLPPPPAVGATGPFFPRQGDRMQTSTNLYIQGEQPGAALDTEASPSPAVISPPNSRPVFLPHRYGQIGVGGPYYGQAPSSCTSTSMFGAPYYPADGAGSDMRPQVHPSPIVDVTGKQQPAMSSLSPPVNQSTFSRSPASTSPSVVEHRASPNAQRDVQETLANHGSR